MCGVNERVGLCCLERDIFTALVCFVSCFFFFLQMLPPSLQVWFLQSFNMTPTRFFKVRITQVQLAVFLYCRGAQQMLDPLVVGEGTAWGHEMFG